MGILRNTIYQAVEDVIDDIKDDLEERGKEINQILKNELDETLSGEGTGRKYKIKSTGKYYTASAAGEAPATRTGELKNSFSKVLSMVNDSIHASVESNLQVGKTNKYNLAELLDKGTKKMSPRPFKKKTLQGALKEAEPILQKKYKSKKRTYVVKI